MANAVSLEDEMRETIAGLRKQVSLLETQRDQALNGLKWVIDIEEGKIKVGPGEIKKTCLQIMAGISGC